MALTPSPWHAWDEQNVLLNLDSHPDGLSHQEARHRLTEYGPNRLTPPKGESWLHRFARQFHNLLIYVLLLAAGLSWLSNHWIDGAVILGVVIINALFGLLQEGKAERALAAIRQLLKIRCTALRDGERHQLDADLLVPGDVVMLESGDKVPADMRLLECHNLYVQESALTGESVSVNKQAQPLPEATPLAERNNMLYAGTLITQGRARAIVVSTGDDTELGHIGRLLQTVEAMQTPLTLQMDRLGRQLTLWIVLLAIATFLFGLLYRHYDLDELFMAAVGLAVAAIPEGLPAVITITLAIGVQRMAQRNAIVRRLPAVETLGAVTVICSDKTGTLTRNEMTVQQVALPHETLQVTGVGYATQGELRPQPSIHESKAPHHSANPSVFIDDTDALWSLLEAAVLCNDARFSPPTPDKEPQLHGDPTEGALLILAAKAGIDAQMLRNANPRLAELPFESAHGFMATLNQQGSQPRLFIKGAPERILSRCDLPAGTTTDSWQQRADQMARAGLRLLAFAVHPIPQSEADSSSYLAADALPPSGWQLLGLVGMVDPAREEAKSAVAECQRAGIRIVMITGDHASTAMAIGQQLGLADEPRVLSGSELDQLSDDELAQQIGRLDILARATPSHKLRLIAALQAAGHITAMTGDGVNDAPALKRADIGVAMGRQGTEAAKEAASMVLADDNFATLRDAVSEGRTIYENLRKALVFLLPTNGAQALVLLSAIVLGIALPITPVQILWVNMVSAITLSLPLAFEQPDGDLMRRPPRNIGEPILPLALWLLIIGSAILMSGLTLGIYRWSLQLGADLAVARTLAINTLIAAEMLFLINCRSLRRASFSHQAWFGNRHVWLAIGSLLLLQWLQTYVPLMNTLFGTAPVDWDLWPWVMLAALLYYLLIETGKWLLRRCTAL
ncbi:MAG: HAD-IC family P-type ATPase [Aeromonas sp.]|nr:HAD-IC family P-type ATPase [Aeromonas sp.]